MANIVTDLYDRAFGGQQNLSQAERWTSMGLGVVMAAAGLNRGGLPGALMGLAGGALAARGLSGHCPAKAALMDRGRHPYRPDQYRPQNEMDYPRQPREMQSLSSADL